MRLGVAMALVAGTAAAQPTSPRLALLPIIPSGLVQPVAIVNPGDGSGRLFLVEQPGKIRIWKDGGLLPSPFLDLGSSAGGLNLISGCTATSCGGERGFLGLAFHPDYVNNGFFYVDYTRANGDLVVSRFHVSADSDVADATSGDPLLTIPHSTRSNHNGGNLAFGPADGYLYVGTGDGGGSGDPDENAQNLNSLLGKMLRIDVDGDDFPADGDKDYAIPAANPFVGAVGADEIWALGLRNPWRWSFDALTFGLYIGDVGQNAFEEIDFEPAGGAGGLNYGWDCREGFHAYDSPTDNEDCSQQVSPGYVEPVLEYGHGPECSVTGGYVYRGGASASIYGRYVYGDYCSGRIWSGVKAGAWTSSELFDTTFNISAFGQDEELKLYVADRTGGAVYRIAPYSFVDVTPGAKTWEAVEALYLARVSLGCGGGNYCTGDLVQRQQIAALLLRAQDPDSDPQGCASSYTDLPAGSETCRWVRASIEGGISELCDGPGNRFCPTQPVTRAVLAGMLLRAVHSGQVAAFPCGATAAAADVDSTHPQCDWINSALKEGLMPLCDVDGDRFCPDAPVRRDQLALWFAGGFPATIPAQTP